jgi:hypothetical protein
MYPSIAEKIRKNPEVLGTALTTLEKWSILGNVPENRLTEWRSILKKARTGRAGRKELMAILRNPSRKDRRLLDFAPFAGILSREERRKVFLKCAYDH